MASISVELLINHLSTLIKQLQEQQDDTHSVKLIQLKEKMTQHELSIALCGHFSAGKSTLINTLCGAKLLPSSPIPTSANVVTLAYGEQPQAEVTIVNNGEHRLAIVPIAQLADYCVDGETYSSVKITYPSEFLKQGIMLLDTPGIDSTDDAHRMSTESALHLADVVFYVMDYNHVQSEINFSFAKQLKEWGKPLYFIVNQIDKHRDEELLFEQYAKSVWDAFQAWHLEPAGIIYLSLKNPEHKEHQWDSLVHLCKQLIVDVEPLKIESVKASLKHVIQEHIAFHEVKDDVLLEQALSALGGKQHIEVVLERINELQTQKDLVVQEKEQIVPQFRIELDHILKNSNITPASFRDKVALFLESQKPGFKQGFLFTKGKTEAEQNLRLEAVFEQLVELVNSNIEWHIQQALRNYIKLYEIEPTILDGWLVKLEQCMPVRETLVNQIAQGAVFSNEYTITYCANLAESIKRRYRDQTLSILEQIIEVELAERFSEQVTLIANEVSALQKSLIGATIYFDHKAQHEAYKNQLISAISAIVIPERVVLPAIQYDLDHASPQHSFVEQHEIINIAQVAATQQVEYVGLEQINALKKQYKQTNEVLLQAAAIVKQVDQLKVLAEGLSAKAERLSSMNFTISLFGAFSAGKSSLANALIGDAVLPVSPNPTTAAINSILPPNDLHRHDTATIFMKPEQVMLDDLIYSLRLLGLYDSDVAISKDILFNIIDKIKPSDIANSGRAHYSFVKAARKGWATEGKHLGQSIEVDRDKYVAYVAEESLSCFVQEIKFYYDCPLTASGIVLVDTPGADSVNARHTGVAFNYIKNTDAIIFVTYYNHAFSHADRQFLDQLGRVKDQFELDKMFFIVNAADLASSDEELKGVLKHVETNLESHHIKNPRLFPISSIMALEAKQSSNVEQLSYSGLLGFEQQFYSFIQVELGQMVVEAAKNELVAVQQEVKQLLHTAKRDLINKDENILKLQAIDNQFNEYLYTRLEQATPDSLSQEISELTYYIVQRIQLRFTDFFNYAINPSAIKEDGRNMQQVLFTAWLELERTLALELKQELLATTLRIEKYTHCLIEEQLSFVSKWLAERNILSSFTYQSIPLQQPIERQDWSLADISSKWLWSYFKSARQFFEQQGKQKLKVDIEPLIFESMKHWMLETSAQWKLFYDEVYRMQYNNTLNNMRNHTTLYIEQATKLLNDESYMSEIETISKQLEKLN